VFRHGLSRNKRGREKRSSPSGAEPRVLRNKTAAYASLKYSLLIE
jgi:hypothetical protein